MARKIAWPTSSVCLLTSGALQMPRNGAAKERDQTTELSVTEEVSGRRSKKLRNFPQSCLLISNGSSQEKTPKARDCMQPVHSCVFAALSRVSSSFICSCHVNDRVCSYSPPGYWKDCWSDVRKGEGPGEGPDKKLQKLRNDALDDVWTMLLKEHGMIRAEHEGKSAPIPFHACSVCPHHFVRLIACHTCFTRGVRRYKSTTLACSILCIGILAPHTAGLHNCEKPKEEAFGERKARRTADLQEIVDRTCKRCPKAKAKPLAAQSSSDSSADVPARNPRALFPACSSPSDEPSPLAAAPVTPTDRTPTPEMRDMAAHGPPDVRADHGGEHAPIPSHVWSVCYAMCDRTCGNHE